LRSRKEDAKAKKKNRASNLQPQQNFTSTNLSDHQSTPKPKNLSDVWRRSFKPNVHQSHIQTNSKSAKKKNNTRKRKNYNCNSKSLLMKPLIDTFSNDFESFGEFRFV